MLMSRFGWVLVALSVPAANLGFIPFIGPLLAFLLGPQLFLLGILLIIFAAVRKHVWDIHRRVQLMVAAIVLVSLNTRLPSILADAVSSSDLTVVRQLEITPGTPLHVQSNFDDIRAALDVEYGARPACQGDGCFGAKGFRTADARLSPRWQESVTQAVAEQGFAIAKEGERAATLRVDGSSSTARLTRLSIELDDADGAPVARLNARVRHCYLFECPGTEAGSLDTVTGTLRFLLHGNFISVAVAGWTLPEDDEPIERLFSPALRVVD